jgi:prepilin-type N-terminal cleavage/methylation domain-containing protein
MNKGFTLIELIVVIAIIAVLSGVILFSITQYISKGKDSNVSGNLAVLVPAGEVFYNGNGNSYQGFCDPSTPNGNSIIRNAIQQMPQNSASSCYCDPKTFCPSPSTWTSTSNPAGVCCSTTGQTNNYQAWAACAREFTNSSLAYCVDSRGVKKEIDNNFCKSSLTQCP